MIKELNEKEEFEVEWKYFPTMDSLRKTDESEINPVVTVANYGLFNYVSINSTPTFKAEIRPFCEI